MIQAFGGFQEYNIVYCWFCVSDFFSFLIINVPIQEFWVILPNSVRFSYHVVAKHFVRLTVMCH